MRVATAETGVLLLSGPHLAIGKRRHMMRHNHFNGKRYAVAAFFQ